MRACRSVDLQTDRNADSSAHHSCPAATCVANIMIISASLASSRVCQCMRGRSPTRGDLPCTPSGIGASDAHVRLSTLKPDALEGVDVPTEFTALTVNV